MRRAREEQVKVKTDLDWRCLTEREPETKLIVVSS